MPAIIRELPQANKDHSTGIVHMLVSLFLFVSKKRNEIKCKQLEVEALSDAFVTVCLHLIILSISLVTSI